MGHDRLLRFPEVKDRVGFSRSSIYRLMRQGDFPEPLKTGASGASQTSPSGSIPVPRLTATSPKPYLLDRVLAVS